MNSIYSKILLWCFGILVLLLVTCLALTILFAGQTAKSQFTSLSERQLESARAAYEMNGTKGLQNYFHLVQQFLPGEHYLANASGRDLLTNTDLSYLLRENHSGLRPRPWSRRQAANVFRSADGKYQLITVFQPPPEPHSLFLYYGLILLGITLLCLILANNIASPIRQLVRVVNRFGRGELAVRMPSKRRDEVGQLARAFNEMADRISTLLEAEKQLLQDISHELRSPLVRLSFAAESLKSAEDRDSAAFRLDRELKRLTNFVGALLEITRMEGEPSLHSQQKLYLDELLMEIINDCDLEASARSCELRVNARGPIAFRGDPELLRRAIDNILRNAIRYAPDGSTIDIDLLTAEQRFLLSIRDRGPGVPEEMLQKIFKPFFCVDTARDVAKGGVGLGLSIAERAVRLHGGSVTAENAMPGLLVTIELPISEPQSMMDGSETHRVKSTRHISPQRAY